MVSENHPPKEDCRFCKGTGDRRVKLSSGRVTETRCICVFVDHSISDGVAKEIGAAARRIRQRQGL